MPSRPAVPSGLIPPLALSGTTSSSTLTSGVSGAGAAVLPILALSLAVVWQALRRQALLLPNGITLNVPTPPA